LSSETRMPSSSVRWILATVSCAWWPTTGTPASATRKTSGRHDPIRGDRQVGWPDIRPHRSRGARGSKPGLELQPGAGQRGVPEPHAVHRTLGRWRSDHPGEGLLKIIPLVAIVDQRTYDKLAPVVREVAERMETTASDRVRELNRQLGWDCDSIAWGLLLRRLTELVVEVEINDGTKSTIHRLEGE